MMVHSIRSIILSRFILDLRDKSEEDSASLPPQSALTFAQRLEDSLGGSLNSIWGSGINGDGEDSQVQNRPEILLRQQGGQRV